MEGAEQQVAVRLAPTGTKRRTGDLKEMALFMAAKAEGIQIFIEDKRDDGIGDDIIKQKLITRFKLTDEEADYFLKKSEENAATTG